MFFFNKNILHLFDSFQLFCALVVFLILTSNNTYGLKYKPFHPRIDSQSLPNVLEGDSSIKTNPGDGNVKENGNANINPWAYYMEMFNIPKINQGIDEGAQQQSLGNCPIFNRIFDGISNLVDSVTLTEIQSPQVQTTVKLPKQLSVTDCVNSIKSTENCASDESKQKCNNLFFLYDLKTKNCSKHTSVAEITNSVKVASPENAYVYGSLNIREDWKDACPIKPIKGAIFGKWNNGKCERLQTKDATVGAITESNHCFGQLFHNNYDETNKENGYGWASFYDTTCIISNEKPDCLINENNAYSFTSLSMGSTSIYDLPQCMEATKDWEVEANCFDGNTRKYRCKNNQWEADDKTKISTCYSNHEWANLGVLSPDGLGMALLSLEQEQPKVPEKPIRPCDGKCEEEEEEDEEKEELKEEKEDEDEEDCDTASGKQRIYKAYNYLRDTTPQGNGKGTTRSSAEAFELNKLIIGGTAFLISTLLFL